MRISVVGSGYVGLVAGACLADSGNAVTCIDTDEQKIRWLEDGYLPIYEPGLEDLVRRNVRQKRLAFSTDYASVAKAQVVFIAVGTPPGDDGSADLRHVLAAAAEIARHLREYTAVVLKSTVPVGTTDQVREAMARLTEAEFDVVSNPEFLKEGAAIDDFQKPDRVVVGTASERARKLLAEIYAPFVRTEKPILFMDPRSAELTKYAANAMLATRISFMNDIALLCERIGADVDQVRKGAGADRRIGYSFLFPGVGYGGSCFPKDVSALIAAGRETGVDLEILKAVEHTNRRQKRALVDKAMRHFAGAIAGKRFAVWGLAFKPKTDDMRESPAVEVIEGLLGKGATIRCHDPVAEAVAEKHFGARISYAETPYDCVEGADALFVVTEWNQFRKPDLTRIRQSMRLPVVFDGRNIFDPEAMREAGFVYYGIGRR
ncbi:UDP-glucose dehydrogenase family protein [Anaeromyxobacter diazotrophicus]|uniref:UDP-glucose 6-dehydrogenase n=1 Tax=Anaeromyxobacter diazotrophicus TaxID=2590199 RepID=A0A7I9VPG0_9BACT|nr:UDP-glucose/GDP-mannose dehydrogenase family protein [Anaeromyxobacter diazotrophicus]GEJ58304.1 UDP-glucose 6-dehydrogenase [Anaeromyxobacter diazotrophicus]